MNKLKEKLKSSRSIKMVSLWMLSPPRQARPRWWIKNFVNPFFHKKGRRSLIRRSARMDVFPYHFFQLGEGSTVEDFCVVNNGVGTVLIGDHTRIGIGSVLIGPVKIGNHVRLAQNVVITALNHNYEDVSRPISQQGVSTKEVVIGDESWIGSNSVVLPGITIGKHCVIAAGSVVTKDVPDFCVVAGNPSKIVKRFNPLQKAWLKEYAHIVQT